MLQSARAIPRRDLGDGARGRSRFIRGGYPGGAAGEAEAEVREAV